MLTFKYLARDRQGKSLSGVVEAQDRPSAIDILRKQDLVIISVEESAARFKLAMPLLTKQRIKIDDLVVFSRQLATMVDAGIPLVGALDILGEQMDNKTFGSVIKTARNDVETGSSLSDALGKHK
nr:type II secretion system F family protein [Candidatus Omnitrophota bacterium]